jgi:hypothetical protein
MAEAITKDDLVAAVTAAVSAALAATSGAVVRPAPREPSTEKTGDNTHLAQQRGYDSQAGIFYEPGQAIAPGVTVGSWMEKVTAKNRNAAEPADAA